MNIRNALKLAQKDLMHHLHLPNSEARLEAQMLLMFSSGDVSRAWLITHENDVIESNAYTTFQTLLKRRLAGEPIAYILGYREFYGLKLKVTPDTLIPRPDTETLVEAALEKIPKNQPTKILDLGTGTGAIAIAIAKHRPRAHITAIDSNQTTLEVAKENAENLQIANVNFMRSDWFKKLKNQQFDMILSNPPYIEENDAHLKQGDLRFEPLSALASGEDGLEAIRHIINNAPQYLMPNGWLLLEHGYNQSQNVAHLFTQHKFSSIAHIKDLADINRVTLASI
jgi:release factor glutamine methyltransferase